MAWSEWKKLNATPLFYKSTGTVYGVTTGGKTTVIDTLDVSEFKHLNAYAVIISTGNSSKGNIRFYDIEDNLIAETGVITHQNYGTLENIDISNYDEIVIKIVGTGTASGNTARPHLTVICY